MRIYYYNHEEFIKKTKPKKKNNLMFNKTHHFNSNKSTTVLEPLFSIPRKPRILSRNNDENKVPPAPQIIITDHTRSYSSLQSKPPPPLSSDINYSNPPFQREYSGFLSPKTPTLLTAPGVDSKRSRSFSPGETSNKSYIMPPAASLRIDVKSPRNIIAKRKEWLIGKQGLIKEKTQELLRKMEELKFLRERNISLNYEMQEMKIFRNRAAISEKLKEDYGMLNGVLFDLLKAGERLRGEWGRTAGFRILTERFEMEKRRKERLEERVKDIRAKYLKLKFYEELMVINFAIQKEDEKRRLMFFNMKRR